MAEVPGDTNRTIVLLLLLLLPRQGHPRPSRHPRWKPQSVSSVSLSPDLSPVNVSLKNPILFLPYPPATALVWLVPPRLGCGSSFWSASLLSAASPPRPTSLDFLR